MTVLSVNQFLGVRSLPHVNHLERIGRILVLQTRIVAVGTLLGANFLLRNNAERGSQWIIRVSHRLGWQLRRLHALSSDGV